MSTAEDRIDGRTLRHRHRRPELLRAVQEYILDHGVADLSLRPMADELGVSHSTLLRHFGTKDALVAEVIEAIRSEFFARPRPTPDGAPLVEVLRATWRHLCRPAERRQFLLLFEVVAMEARAPGRFDSLEAMIIADFLGPMVASMRQHGLSVREARDLATGYLAMVRGLQLDLAVSGDQRRVDASMRRYVDTIVRTSE